ncbi:hypothetical protein [Streptomyces hygroscopicus]|uniref:hypothetical protein n=1 Tax=Streptomyces hygroscopicus TaxID=1912 RepID=UPI0033EC5882
MTEQKPPAIRQLDALVDRLVPGVSAQRARQLRMVAGMFGRAVDREGMPPWAGPELARLFTQPVLQRFWKLAVAGELRHRAEDAGKPLPLATQRVVRDCLVILAEATVPGREVWLPTLGGVEPKPVVSPREQLLLYRKLADMAERGPWERDGTALSADDRARLLAMVGVVLDSGARSRELEQMRLDDLVDGGSAIRVVRRPQNATHLPLRVGVWALREGTQVAVRRWLGVRERLVADVEGAKTALWVSLRARGMRRGGVERSWPAGVPLGTYGIQSAYARGITALNWVMAGEFGWSPLPGRLEQLGRAVRAGLGEEPPRRVDRPRRLPGRPRAPLSAERVARAQELLEDPAVTVDEVAAAIGVSLETLYAQVPGVRDRPSSRGRG